MNIRMCTVIVLCVILSMSLSAEAAIKYADCYRSNGTIKIDGLLDESSWAYAKDLSPFTNYNGTTTNLTTTLRMCWDDKAIYLAFQCADNDIYSTFTTRDCNTWEQEVVEMFAMTQPQGTGYVEFENTPRGEIWDGMFTDRFVPSNASIWNSPTFATATQIYGTLNNKNDTDQGWVVEAAFPWADIYGTSTIPTDGTSIRMNFYRINSNTPTVLGNPGTNYSYLCWSQVDIIDFHQPSKFGEVTFHTQVVPEPSEIATLVSGSMMGIWFFITRRKAQRKS